MEERRQKVLIKILRIALAVALFCAFVSLILARLDSAPFFLSLTAFFMMLSFFFGFNLLILLIFWD